MTTQNKNNTDNNKTSIATMARIAAALSLSLTGLAMTTSMASAITPPTGSYEPGDIVANPDTSTPPPTNPRPPITRPEAPDAGEVCDDSISNCGGNSKDTDPCEVGPGKIDAIDLDRTGDLVNKLKVQPPCETGPDPVDPPEIPDPCVPGPTWECDPDPTEPHPEPEPEPDPCDVEGSETPDPNDIDKPIDGCNPPFTG